VKNYQKMFMVLAAIALVACAQAAQEYAEGHVPGAMNISHDELENRLSELGIELDDELIVYCRSGRRAGIAEGILGEAGYTNLRNLEGHWLGWSADGRPSE